MHAHPLYLRWPEHVVGSGRSLLSIVSCEWTAVVLERSVVLDENVKGPSPELCSDIFWALPNKDRE